MSVVSRYNQAVRQNQIADDPAQRAVIKELEQLEQALSNRRNSWLAKIRLPKIKGFYLFGPVGVGKTFLMDLFYQSIDYPNKARYHFHHFMQQVDMKLRQMQGEKNPLHHIAADLAKTSRLLCFDEFLVHDVAHAMMLAELLEALIARGVVLVITSNTPPDELYLHGVQRKRFLPAIALIKEHCHVHALENKMDYRLGRERSLEAYLYPLNAENRQKMEEQFDAIAPGAARDGELMVQNRSIPYIRCSLQEKAIWFDFSVICQLPRSQLDYLEIAERFDTVFVSNIRQMTEQDTQAAILFILFIDVMYDRGIHVILLADVPVDQLYLKGEMHQEYQRTLSRLHEMQSTNYLNRTPRK